MARDDRGGAIIIIIVMSFAKIVMKTSKCLLTRKQTI
jgi:hypothetical protein